MQSKLVMAAVLVAWIAGAVFGPVSFGADAPAPEAGPGDAWMGVFLGDAVDGGVYVVAIVPGGPADRAGLEAGDIVLEAGDRVVLSASDLTRVVDNSGPGVPLRLRWVRAGAGSEGLVDLERRPAPARLIRGVAPPAPPRPQRGVAGSASRGYGLGLAVVTPDLRRHYGAPEDAGVLVVGLEAELPAKQDGFRVGDLLVRLDDRTIREVRDVDDVLSARGLTKLRAELIREGRTTEIMVHASKPEEAPGNPAPTEREAREALEGALRLEIERLEKRIEALRLELGEIDDER